MVPSKKLSNNDNGIFNSGEARTYIPASTCVNEEDDDCRLASSAILSFLMVTVGADSGIDKCPALKNAAHANVKPDKKAITTCHQCDKFGEEKRLLMVGAPSNKVDWPLVAEVLMMLLALFRWRTIAEVCF
jgi:hypothetical protein